MQLGCHACSPSNTKTSGIQTVLLLTLQQNIFGVQLKQIIKVNAGATAQLHVSTASQRTVQSFQWAIATEEAIHLNILAIKFNKEELRSALNIGWIWIVKYFKKRKKTIKCFLRGFKTHEIWWESWQYGQELLFDFGFFCFPVS